MDTAPLILAIIFLLFFFQMVALNFDRILLMLVDQGSIPRDTLQSQDGLNMGDVRFCPMRRTLHMQCISLDHLQGLIAKGVFMPPTSEGPPKLSRTTAILLVFQADSQHDHRCLCGAHGLQGQVPPVYSGPDPRLRYGYRGQPQGSA